MEVAHRPLSGYQDASDAYLEDIASRGRAGAIVADKEDWDDAIARFFESFAGRSTDTSLNLYAMRLMSCSTKSKKVFKNGKPV